MTLKSVTSKKKVYYTLKKKSLNFMYSYECTTAASYSNLTAATKEDLRRYFFLRAAAGNDTLRMEDAD